MKKTVINIIGILIVLLLVYCIGSGFTRVPSAYISDYSVSPDGSEITLTVGVGSSVGFIRKVAVHQQQGGKIYLDCFSAFGGFNGKIGAKNTFTLPLNEDTTIIALYRSADCYETVLEKDTDGTWH